VPGKNSDNQVAKCPIRERGPSSQQGQGLSSRRKRTPPQHCLPGRYCRHNYRRAERAASVPHLEEAREHARKRHSEVTRLGHDAFLLTSSQRNDAVRAIEVLKPFKLTMEAAAKLAVSHLPTNRGQVSVAELRKLFLAAPGRRKSQLLQRRPLTLHNLEWRTNRFAREHGERPLLEISSNTVAQWLSSLGKLSPVSLNNYRRSLHAMFGFAVAEGYCVTNPVSKIPLFAVPDRTPSILTVESAARLIAVAAED